MMTREQYLLGKIAEEASEIAQIALKAQQFGFDSYHPARPADTNLKLLKAEVNDLLAVLLMLGEPIAPYIFFNNEAQQDKQRKVRKYYELSQRLGRVE